MVVPNILGKSDGNCQIQTRRPRKFLFDIGVYNVAAHMHGKRYSISVWDDKIKIGSISLSPYYDEVATIYSADTRISEEYQGIGIGYRVYEGLVLETRISIITSCQSIGAMKLWRRFAENRHLSVYFVSGRDELFRSDVFNVVLADGCLRGAATRELFDPYTVEGSLLLVRRKSPIQKAIEQHMLLHERQKTVLNHFKRYDHHKLSHAAIGCRKMKL